MLSDWLQVSIPVSTLASSPDKGTVTSRRCDLGFLQGWPLTWSVTHRNGAVTDWAPQCCARTVTINCATSFTMLKKGKNYCCKPTNVKVAQIPRYTQGSTYTASRHASSKKVHRRHCHGSQCHVGDGGMTAHPPGCTGITVEVPLPLSWQ